MSTIKLDTDEKLKAHILGLQETLTQRNATIAELRAKLAEPIDSPENIKKITTKAYREGWKDCALRLRSTTMDASAALARVNDTAFKVSMELN